MKRLILSLLIIVITITGCTTSEEKELKEEAENKIEEVQNENYFDENRWNVEIRCNYVFGLYCRKDSKYTVFTYNHVEEEKLYMDVPLPFYGGGGFNKYYIMKKYLTEYIYNDYIFNREYGNDMGEFFRELDNDNIKYYIGEIGIGTYYYYGNIVDMYEDEVEVRRVEKIMDTYTAGGESLEDIDYGDLFRSLEYKAELIIYINEDSLEKNNISIDELQKLSKKYYNSDKIIVDIEKLEGQTKVIDSRQRYVINGTTNTYRYGSLDEFMPMYNFY